MRPKLLARMAGAFLLALASSADADTWTWTGNAGQAPWDTDGQWSTALAPAFDDTGTGPHGDDLIFPATAAVTTINLRNLNAPDAALSMLFEAGSPAYRFQRSDFPTQPIHLWGDLTTEADATQTFASGLALEGNITITAAHGDPATAYAFDFGDHLGINGTPTYLGPFHAHISGTGGSALRGSGELIINNASLVVEGGWDATLTKSGNGLLLLNGASTTTRVLKIQAGTVRITHSAALGFTGSTRNTVLLGGATGSGTLEFSGDLNVGEYLVLQGRQGAAGATVALQNHSGHTTLSGPITFQGPGQQFNFAASAGQLTIATHAVFPSSLVGSQYLNFRGPGDGEISGFIGANNLGADDDLPGQVVLVHRGAGTLTLSGTDNWRLGHILNLGGGTLKFAATFANFEADQSRYPLFVATDDLAIPNATRFVLLNGSRFDFTSLASTGGSNIGLAGGGLRLDRTLAGVGTVLGHVQAAATGTPALAPGDGVAWDPADPSGSTLDPTCAFPPGVGTLAFANDLDLSTGPAEYTWHLARLVDQTDGVPGADWDFIQVAGQTKLAPIDTLKISFEHLAEGGPADGAPFWSQPHAWKILDTTASAEGTANFGPIQVLGPDFFTGSFSVTLGTGADVGDVFLNWIIPPAAHRLADLDADGDVDAADRALLVACYQGPEILRLANCENCDLDRDADVDQMDFGIWQTCFSGAGLQAAIPQCTATTVPPPPQQ